ncbi:TATA box-binding protein-associated factor RNA polymerase I subunit A [Mastacembelus armatus]|uniref:TATA-box binding protein associated factor, RNA polymerase I subunit A n=1 Tax=Mastacembelus armatus TaxID=205130 RepID=A0A3Q3KZX7_9TELE|nr:TATA box-binding protein-associated factor RNA polymerase I subunit A [Mastacembelus armatus]XP_026173929.1 TATA box-binding protein-associated factor RNA polymerase I subunit A [Mastacembelus armatus]XP_026173931.1 TATA box-binding protein-associated factor RNA polymerase I subunit A [Mastacembelus armatus]
MMDDLDRELGSLEHSEHDDDTSDNNSVKRGKKSKLPLANLTYAETPKETGFHQSTRVCLEKIREALLHHRWQEAAEYMACYPQILEDTTRGSALQHKELIWRMSTEILHHHPNSKLEDYNNIYERMKHSGVKDYLMVSLEHSFHLLLHGHIEDAKRQLSVAESWRYGKESAVQYQNIKLIQAYKSLLDYIIWCDKKFTHSNPDYIDSGDNQEMHNYFRQASVNLKEILRNPGIWDPFILCYVEMLEFYEDHEEALKVLNDYAYDNNFPPNPNAHVYLYQYLKRHDAPEKKLMKVLKILRVLVPSHELMLEYSSFLLQSEKTSDDQKALGVVLEMLDFACWRSSLDVWKCLKNIIQKLQLEEDWKNIVSEKMAGRQDWWPALHFTSFHARKDAEENPELMEVKSSLTKILCPELMLKYDAESVTSGEQT